MLVCYMQVTFEFSGVVFACLSLIARNGILICNNGCYYAVLFELLLWVNVIVLGL